MRVLLLTNHLNPGGITSYCLLLARHLKERGDEVLIASGGGKMEAAAREIGVSHRRVPVDTSSELNPKLLGAYPELARIVRENRIELVHEQTRVAQTLGFFLGRHLKVRRVSTCHGYFKRRFFRKLFPLWGERVIAVSDAVGAHLERDWGLDPSRIRVIPHGTEAPLEADAALREAVRGRWGVPSDAVVIGALGRLSSVKGFDVLVRASAALKKNGSPTKERGWPRVVIAGEGQELGRLRQLAASEGVADSVDFETGFEEPGDFFSAVDVFCAPSIEEGFGLSVLEAMRHACPVVASRVGGIPGLVGEEAGLLVPPGDPPALAEALGRLLEDARLRGRLGKAGQERVLKLFPVQTMIDKTRSVYEEVLQR